MDRRADQAHWKVTKWKSRIISLKGGIVKSTKWCRKETAEFQEKKLNLTINGSHCQVFSAFWKHSPHPNMLWRKSIWKTMGSIWRRQRANGRETGNWQVLNEAIRGTAMKVNDKRQINNKILKIHLVSSKGISLRQEELPWNQTTKGKVDKAWKLWLEHLHFCCEEPCFWQGWRRWIYYKRYFEVAAMISEGEVFDSIWQLLSLSWISSYPLSSSNSNFNPLRQLDS